MDFVKGDLLLDWDIFGCTQSVPLMKSVLYPLKFLYYMYIPGILCRKSQGAFESTVGHRRRKVITHTKFFSQDSKIQLLVKFSAKGE